MADAPTDPWERAVAYYDEAMPLTETTFHAVLGHADEPTLPYMTTARHVTVRRPPPYDWQTSDPDLA